MHQYDEWELEDIKKLLVERRNAEALPRLYKLAAAYPYNQEIQNLLVKGNMKQHSRSAAFYFFWTGFAFQVLAVLYKQTSLFSLLFIIFITISLVLELIALCIWLYNRQGN